MEIKEAVWNLFLIVSSVSFMFMLALSNNFGPTGFAISSSAGISYGNIEQQLSSNNVVKELPDDAVILLRFYNFNPGYRVWERTYIIKKGSVKEGSIDNPDVTLIVASKYMSQMTNTNFCEVIKKAKANNDLGVRINISWARFLWKYKSMFGYRGCFGF